MSSIDQDGNWISDEDDMTGDEADPNTEERTNTNDVSQTDITPKKKDKEE